MLALLSLPARAQGGPGRIAVAGEFPSGYVGCLARYGLPRDLLSTDQLGDPERLATYNLVIVAGMPGQGERPFPGGPGGRRAGVDPRVPPKGDGVVAALQAVLARGGSVLLDYSQPSPLIGELLGNAGGNAWVRNFATFGIAGRSRSSFHLVGQNNPLLGEVKLTDEFPPNRMGLVPVVAGLNDVTVLAEYRAHSPLGQGLRPERGDARREGPDTGPAAPAIAWLPHGNGKILICGPGVGMGTQLMGSDYDQLTLAMVRFLTNGRAVPQLEPDMAHLGRKQSARSLGDKEGEDPPHADVPMPAAPTPADTLPDARPAGPGAAAPLPKGYSAIEPQTTVQYDLSGKLGAGSAELLLNYWNPTHMLRVVFGPKSTDVVKLNGQYTRTLASAPGRVAPGTAVLVKERWDKLTVLAGTVRLEAVIKGIHAGGAAAKGFDGEVQYQSVEEVFFADDFMRTNDKNGG
ncbi:MAG: hypothetical protein HYU66_26770, partial [Armatimonadetes bacterium]|nr:hypothetical protein [Armatimonadota bacterium]